VLAGHVEQAQPAGLGVHSPGVGHHADPLRPDRRQDTLDEIDEVGGVAPGRVAAPLLLQDRHRDLRQIVEGQHVERTLLHQADRCIDRVAPESLTVGDTQTAAVRHET